MTGLPLPRMKQPPGDWILRRAQFSSWLAVTFLGLVPTAASAVSGLRTAAERMTLTHSIAAVATNASGGSKQAFIARSTLSAGECAASMPFEVALAMRNFSELEARLAHSEIIAPEEMQARYLPLAADHDQIVRWLQSEGLTVTRTDANHLAVFVQAPVAEVARVFQVTFARVVAEGAEFTSAISAPSIPSKLAAAVRGIHGLQPHQRLRRRPHAALRPFAGTGNSLPYYPAQIKQAYNASALTQTGAGQTIAVYALGYPLASDLTSFWATTGATASPSNIQQINVAGGPKSTTTSAGSIEEATLDVEWASALAPGAVIRIYAASETDPVADDELIQQVLADLPTQPTLHQLSISYGSDETTSDRDYIAIEAQYMANLVSAGVTVFAASGDLGPFGNNGAVQIDYPASMPDVTAVGGTALTLNPDGTVASETAWGSVASSGASGASGGGISIIFNRPAWQTGAGVPAGTMRLVPDVAAVGDPSTGGLIVLNGRNATIGGTSLATPIWAAWCALINQARANAGKSPLGALNPRLYPLAGTAAFRDITSGGNTLFQAGPGYDLCTGIGVPNVYALMQATLADSFAPVIEVQSGDRFTTTGQAATFYLIATGNPALAYHWQRQPAGTSTWTDLVDNTTYSGSGTYALLVNGATAAMNGDRFQCVVRNPIATVTGPPATLTVADVGVSTLAGWPGWSGFADGEGSAGRFNYTGSVRIGPDGTIYVADAQNNTIRKITPTGVVSTLAGAPGVEGSTDGPGSAARFSGPAGVSIDATGNVYVADSQNFTIRKITPAGVVTTLAGSAGVAGYTDGTGGAASFYDPENIAIDSFGTLYIADGAGNSIRKVTPAGVVTTLAGAAQSGTANGTGSAARFNLLAGIAVDSAGNVYVGDYGNNAVRKITPAGVVTTLAGLPGRRNYGFVDGSGTSARFNAPTGLAVDALGTVFVADSKNNAIRQITSAGIVTTLAGTPTDYENTDGPLAVARFNGPADVALDASGVLYVADALNCTVRRLVLTAPVIAANYLSNLSVRAAIATGQTLIAGFVVDGGAKPILIRAAGPVLSKFGLTGVVDPSLTLYDSTGTVVAQDDNWDASLATTFAATGAFAFDTGSKDAALLQTINGPHTAQATATGPGAILVEAYDAGANDGRKLVNLSARFQVGIGDNILIAGFVLSGTGTRQVLIRAVGPTLATYGVAGTLADPQFSVYDGGTAIAGNDNWSSSLTPTFDTVGAFHLLAASKDAAMVVTLQAGKPYTVQVSGVGGTTGEALVEIYLMP